MTTTTCPTAQAVRRTADAWIAKHPSEKARIERAIAMVANVSFVNRRVSEISGSRFDTFEVEGTSDTYTVSVASSRVGNSVMRESHCSCPDASRRDSRCKHILAVGLFLCAK